jgi:hypothetical protein
VRDVGRTSTGYHHNIQVRKPTFGEVSKFNTRPVAGKVDIGYQRPQLIPSGNQDQFGRFRACTFDNLETLFFQNISQERPLERVVLHHKCNEFQHVILWILNPEWADLFIGFRRERQRDK